MTLHSDAQPAITIRNLTKRFARLVAVKDLNLDVMRGEIFGFLGLNGAGKTTTLRILLDLLRPSAGSAAVAGFDCQSQGMEARRSIGYLPGEPGLYGDMTGRQVLDLLAGIAAQPVSKHYQSELLERLEFPDGDLHRKLRDYSTGMKRKLGLVQALQCDPPVLILDEPTEGLDPLMQQSFYKLLRDLRNKGRTVFMSSHVLSEVERLCDRIGLIRSGELVLVGLVEDVRALAPRKVRISFKADVSVLSSRELQPGYCLLDATARSWHLTAQAPLGPLIQSLVSLPVADLEVEEPHLEEILLSYYRKGGS